MNAHFAVVLDRERARLSAVTDVAGLVRWRQRVVEELLTPRSPYSLALRHRDDGEARAEFVSEWQELIAAAIARVQRKIEAEARDRAAGGSARRHADDRPNAPCPPPTPGIDPERTAVLILAALHGGGALSRLKRDPCALDAALDLALAPLISPRHDEDEDAERAGTLSSMDA